MLTVPRSEFEEVSDVTSQQAPPVLRGRDCVDLRSDDAGVRTQQQPAAAHDFEIQWGCKKIKLATGARSRSWRSICRVPWGLACPPGVSLLRKPFVRISFHQEPGKKINGRKKL